MVVHLVRDFCEGVQPLSFGFGEGGLFFKQFAHKGRLATLVVGTYFFFIQDRMS